MTSSAVCVPRIHRATQSTSRPVPRARQLESGVSGGFVNACMRLALPMVLESNSRLESRGQYEGAAPMECAAPEKAVSREILGGSSREIRHITRLIA